MLGLPQLLTLDLAGTITTQQADDRSTARLTRT